MLLLFGRHEVGAGHERAGHRVFEARLLHLRYANEKPNYMNIDIDNESQSDTYRAVPTAAAAVPPARPRLQPNDRLEESKNRDPTQPAD